MKDSTTKKYIGVFAVVVFSALVLGGASVSAQMMGRSSIADSDDHTASEEAEGKNIWEKLQTKEVNCAGLSDENLGALGEYFMGQMVGEAHPAMNAMMERMMGEKGEEQVHVVMGKRLSGCDTDAIFPSGGRGFMPMMQFMWGGWSAPRGGNAFNTNMMWNGFGAMSGYGWGGAGLISWVTMLLVWAVLVLAIIALWRWIQRR